MIWVWLLENEAEIYQYVGDEVILTWILQDGIKNQNCINAYFKFSKLGSIALRGKEKEVHKCWFLINGCNYQCIL